LIVLVLVLADVLAVELLAMAVPPIASTVTAAQDVIIATVLIERRRGVWLGRGPANLLDMKGLLDGRQAAYELGMM